MHPSRREGLPRAGMYIGPWQEYALYSALAAGAGRRSGSGRANTDGTYTGDSTPHAVTHGARAGTRGTPAAVSTDAHVGYKLVDSPADTGTARRKDAFFGDDDVFTPSHGSTGRLSLSRSLMAGSTLSSGSSTRAPTHPRTQTRSHAGERTSISRPRSSATLKAAASLSVGAPTALSTPTAPRRAQASKFPSAYSTHARAPTLSQAHASNIGSSADARGTRIEELRAMYGLSVTRASTPAATRRSPERARSPAVQSHEHPHHQTSAFAHASTDAGAHVETYALDPGTTPASTRYHQVATTSFRGPEVPSVPPSWAPPTAAYQPGPYAPQAAEMTMHAGAYAAMPYYPSYMPTPQPMVYPPPYMGFAPPLPYGMPMTPHMPGMSESQDKHGFPPPILPYGMPMPMMPMPGVPQPYDAHLFPMPSFPWPAQYAPQHQPQTIGNTAPGARDQADVSREPERHAEAGSRGNSVVSPWEGSAASAPSQRASSPQPTRSTSPGRATRNVNHYMQLFGRGGAPAAAISPPQGGTPRPDTQTSERRRSQAEEEQLNSILHWVDTMERPSTGISTV